MTKPYRKMLSFRKRDKDLLQIFEPFFDPTNEDAQGDFSDTARELMRDGVKWRNAVQQGLVVDPKYLIPHGIPAIPQSTTQKLTKQHAGKIPTPKKDPIEEKMDKL